MCGAELESISDLSGTNCKKLNFFGKNPGFSCEIKAKSNTDSEVA